MDEARKVLADIGLPLIIRPAFTLGGTGGGIAYNVEEFETIVQRGEALGFHSVMIADHVVFPTAIASKYPYTVSGAFPGGGDALEQLALMAFVAGRTRTLRLVTSVMILPYRNPVVTAKMLATIDVLSRGRVTVGVGVGWLREEFEALDSPDFDRRGAASDEYIRIFKTMWTETPASFKGELYQFSALPLPQPVRSLTRRSGSVATARRRCAAWRVMATAGILGANPAVPLRPHLRASLDQLFRMTEAEGATRPR
jgi:alkanesulfonate monooxygenase SsuD/methylene tetrahydromethanopterin reductase-like flavin-dependent oxidoreductase (luciferase family)